MSPRSSFWRGSELPLGLQEHSRTPAEARAIAKDAYVYGYPMVDGYRVQHAYFIDRQNPEFKAPWNELRNIPRVFTPEDKAVQTPNSDTPYSMAGLDLRAEPMVLTVPAIEKARYFSVQLIDLLHSHNFDYIGSRTTGNDGGTFLIAGPRWRGDAPKGVTKVIRAETELVLATYRTQLFNPGDLDNVKHVQAGYKLRRSRRFSANQLPRPRPRSPSSPRSPRRHRKHRLQFFNILNFVLTLCPTVPSESALMERFARIGVGAGKTIDVSTLAPEIKQALEQGMADAWKEFEDFKSAQVDTGKVTSVISSARGTSSRTTTSIGWQPRSSVSMAIPKPRRCIRCTPSTTPTRSSMPRRGRYTLRFEPGELPPVNAFWSVTMYQPAAEPARRQSAESLPAQRGDVAAVCA